MGVSLKTEVSIFKNYLKKILNKDIVKGIQKVRYARSIDRISEDSVTEFEVVKQLVNSGDTVVDVGANMGIYSKLLSNLVGLNGRVLSIEPIPYTYEILTYIVGKLKLNNVKLYNYAISNFDGFLNMEIPKGENGLENYYTAKIINPSEESTYQTVKVQAKTLVSALVNEEKISFIKLDVEGHEFECLQGGAKIIDKYKPSLFIEIWGDPDESNSAAHRTMKFLKEYGYTPFIYEDNKLRKRKLHETKNDYFFLTEGHVNVLKQRSSIF